MLLLLSALPAAASDVDLFAPSAELTVRIDLFGDEIDSLRAFDPTDQRSVRAVDRARLLPASEFLLPQGGVEELRRRLGRLTDRLPERLASDLARFEAGEAPAEERSGEQATTALATSERAAPTRATAARAIERLPR